jgi:hypothetical protein
MSDQARPGTEHTRVSSTAAMRARDVSRDAEAIEHGLRADADAAAGERGSEAVEPQVPVARPDS